jgi:exosome complex component CSL4
MASHSSKQKTGQFVLPGERLGVIEEFIPDAGTYVKDGVIYSRAVGRALVDFLNKRVSVFPVVEAASVPKIGNSVTGQVSNSQSDNANVRIFRIGNKMLTGIFSGVLHIADVQMRYVDSMSDVCRPGDILRAEVISEKNKVYHLSTKDKNMGVVYAFCSQCGYLLEPKRNLMSCPRCGQIEKRKTALDYGKAEL